MLPLAGSAKRRVGKESSKGCESRIAPVLLDRKTLLGVHVAKVLQRREGARADGLRSGRIDLDLVDVTRHRP